MTFPWRWRVWEPPILGTASRETVKVRLLRIRGSLPWRVSIVRTLSRRCVFEIRWLSISYSNLREGTLSGLSIKHKQRRDYNRWWKWRGSQRGFHLVPEDLFLWFLRWKPQSLNIRKSSRLQYQHQRSLRQWEVAPHAKNTSILCRLSTLQDQPPSQSSEIHHFQVLRNLVCLRHGPRRRSKIWYLKSASSARKTQSSTGTSGTRSSAWERTTKRTYFDLL